MESDRPAAPPRNPAQTDEPIYQEVVRQVQHGPRVSSATWQGLSISAATTDTSTQYEGSAQVSAPSFPPIRGLLRAGLEQQGPPSPTRIEGNEDAPVQGGKRTVQRGLEEPSPKRLKITPRKDGQAFDTGQSPGRRPYGDRGLQTWQSAPVAEKKGTGRVSLPASPPSFHRSCPPHYMTAEGQLPKLPSRRSMPVGDLEQGQEAFADLKPSRSVPEHPQGNDGGGLEEGLHTQLSRRSSNSRRSWPRGRGMAGQGSFRIYSNQYGEGGQGDEFLEADAALDEQERDANESPQHSPSPGHEIQAGPEQRSAPGKKTEVAKSPRDVPRTYKPRTKDRWGGRDASSTERRRRGATPLRGRFSTGKSSHPGRMRAGTIYVRLLRMQAGFGTV